MIRDKTIVAEVRAAIDTIEDVQTHIEVHAASKKDVDRLAAMLCDIKQLLIKIQGKLFFEDEPAVGSAVQIRGSRNQVSTILAGRGGAFAIALTLAFLCFLLLGFGDDLFRAIAGWMRAVPK